MAFSALPAGAFLMRLLGRAAGDSQVSDSIFRTELGRIRNRIEFPPWLFSGPCFRPGILCACLEINRILKPCVWGFSMGAWLFCFVLFSGVGEGSGRHLVGIQEMEINHLRLVDWIELVWQTGPDC